MIDQSFILGLMVSDGSGMALSHVQYSVCISYFISIKFFNAFSFEYFRTHLSSPVNVFGMCDGGSHSIDTVSSECFRSE